MSLSVHRVGPRRLFGFDVLATLGHGARSVIYAVKDSKDQVYALKHVAKQEMDDQRYLDQALVDHRTASLFDHPNLRRSYRVIRHRKLMRTQEIALLMELIDGTPLDQASAMDIDPICRVFKQVAGGVQTMHDRGWVHADIKPNNILLTDQGVVKIIDFGQSCPVGTVKERVQGTPDYIAPEQVQREPITPRTDVFNLGATLYWLLTGRPIPTLIPRGEPGCTYKPDPSCPAPHELKAEVPLALSSLVVSCIRPRPSERPESMSRVASRLDLALTQLARNRQ